MIAPTFGWLSLAAWALVVGLAGALRGRLYATFAAVLLGIHTAISNALWPWVSSLPPVGSIPLAAVAYAYLQGSVYVHFASLVRARLRSRAYRALVSVPASYFVAGTFLAFPWAIAVGFGLDPHGAFIPYLVALVGLAQSVRPRREEVHLFVDGEPVRSLVRHPTEPRETSAHRTARPLRLVQITDPHLGPFMSERRLRAIAEAAVSRDPDLVLLTGDFVTMESHAAEEALSRALAPLRALEGRVFACLGNHDHEAPRTVARALDAAGARLLVDEAVVVDTPVGPVDILGLDHHFRDRRTRIADACRAFPRTEGAFRLVLLHDPGAFAHVPDGDADLVLSGHTHGGQLGLLSLGLPHTIVSALTRIPDHGFWAVGRKRLYVHRGTGHYGFPLRIGVPAEDSVLHVHVRRETP